MNFTNFIGNTQAKKQLKTAIKNRKLPKAFIFYGPAGVGKATMARVLAKTLNCTNYDGEPCNTCSSCIKIDKGSHPDIQLYQPEAKEISIEQMRNLSRLIHLKPLEGTYKIFIIDQAEKMSIEAANALLKTLEEPPPNSIIVLIATSLSSLLPTIRSRCQLLHFSTIPKEELELILKEKFNYQPKEALSLAHLSGGSLGGALTINLSENYEKRKRELEFLKLLATEDSFDAILKREPELRGKETIDETLQILYSLVRDMLILSFSKEKELLRNIDLEDDLKSLLNFYKPELLLSIISEIHYTIKAIENNVNRKVAIEALFFSIINLLNNGS